MAQKPAQDRIQQEIEQNLKRVYDQVASEELPSRFTELLNNLKKGSTPSTRSSDEETRDD